MAKAFVTWLASAVKEVGRAVGHQPLGFNDHAPGAGVEIFYS